LGDFWLTAAIQQKLIQPVVADKLKSWQQLPPQWQALVKRNDKGEADKAGKIWGAPYRWGSTVIAYRRDKFESAGLKPPTDWADLWREELRDRISVLDRYREAIGLTLKYLGRSYNEPDLDRVPKLKDTLEQLHRQVKLYSVDNYLQPLILGDIWLAVAWSSDILEMKIKGSDRQISAIVPKSGTALWADLWVKPTSSQANPNLQLPQEWIDFCWQPQSAQSISQFTSAASPILLNLKRDDISKNVRENSLLLPDDRILSNSEFLYPLAEATDKKYRSLWQEIREQ
jgi:putative spermidine/putrescine transport system substrate-binding protein